MREDPRPGARGYGGCPPLRIGDQNIRNIVHYYCDKRQSRYTPPGVVAARLQPRYRPPVMPPERDLEPLGAGPAIIPGNPEVFRYI